MTPAAGRVLRLWRYPVKSMAGETCATLELDADGVAGDRRHALRTADGRLGSGKSTRRFRQVDGLLDFAASSGPAGVAIRFPDGRVLDAAHAHIDAALSDALGQPVALVSGAAHVDAAPVHLLSSASLAWLQTRLPRARLDERRFRPNLVLEVAGALPPEQAWIGRTLAFEGGVRLRLEAPTARCRMVTLPQAGLPEDPGVLRALAETAGLMFGVYAAVETPGKIALGEAARVV